jgi:FG-GAP-like repeat
MRCEPSSQSVALFSGLVLAALTGCCFTPAGESVQQTDAGMFEDAGIDAGEFEDAGMVDGGRPPDGGSPTTCRIDGMTFADGALNPANPCQGCQVAINLSAWIDLVTGSSCPSGVCSSGVCLQGCLIDGGFVPSGSTSSAGCLECLPMSSAVSWSHVPDGTPCQVHDKGKVCYAGSCVSGCVIGGATYPHGAANPRDRSQCCSPTLSSDRWTDRLQDGGVYQVGQFALGLAVADFNRDGLPDLVVSGHGATGDPGTMTIMLGQPGGTLADGVAYPSCSVAWGIEAGDLNGDGFPDLVVPTCYGSGPNSSLWLFFNTADGSGSFAPGVEVDLPVEAFGESFVLQDLDGDGILDLALAGQGAFFLKGLGDGGFADPVTYALPASDSITAGDLTGTGKQDLITATGRANSFTVLLGDAKGSFSGQHRYSVDSTSDQVAVGDFDGDGALDVGITGYWEGATSSEVQLGQGDGTFDISKQVPIDVNGEGGRFIAFADLNGDGRSAALVANSYSEDTLWVVWYNADGNLTWKTFQTGHVPITVIGADVNGDGAQDVIVAALGTSTGEVDIFLNACP